MERRQLVDRIKANAWIVHAFAQHYNKVQQEETFSNFTGNR